MADGSWTAPSAIGMAGVGAGGQFGAELTDFVFVLNTDAAVKTFMQSGSLTLGGNISMAVGPVGRSAEASGVVGTKGAAGVFAYSKTRGLYGGLTVEGGVLIERSDANKKLYGRKVRARELLNGLTPPPPEAEVLMKVLNGTFFQFEPSQTGDQEQSTDGAETSAHAYGAQNPSEAERTGDDPQQVSEAEQTNKPQQTGEAQGHSELEHIDETRQANQTQEADADQIQPVVEAQQAVETEEAMGAERAGDALRAVESQQIKGPTSEEPIENASKEEETISQATEAISKDSQTPQPNEQQPVSAEEHAPDDAGAPPEKPHETQKGAEKE